jgi:hypothetical protein
MSSDQLRCPLPGPDEFGALNRQFIEKLPAHDYFNGSLAREFKAVIWIASPSDGGKKNVRVEDDD